MNDDATTSARPRRAQSVGEQAARATNEPDPDPDPGPPGAVNDESDETVRQKRRQQRRDHGYKRADFLLHLLKSLDGTIFCQLCVMYYMDCSFLRLLLRCVFHYFTLTPKPPIVPEMPHPGPFVGAIFGSNAVCLLFHIINAAPEAGEAVRGYLHGSVITDFVGVKGPVPKFYLITLDFLILALQLCMLAVHAERRELRQSLSSPRQSESSGEGSGEGQTHDAEERGVHAVDNAEQSGEESTADPQRSLMDFDDPNNVSEEELGFDAFFTGEAVVLDVHIFRTVREQWRAYQNRTVTAPSTSAASTTASASGARTQQEAAQAVAEWAGGRLGFEVRLGGQRLG